LLAIVGCGPPPEPYERTRGGVGGKADDTPAPCGDTAGGQIGCPGGQICVRDPGCDPKRQPVCPGICKPAPCGGTAGGWLGCPDGQICVDDPTDTCDPTGNVGADCPGICQPLPPCGGVDDIQCPSGQTCLRQRSDTCDPATSTVCPGLCRPQCGGTAGSQLACPTGLTCVDDPTDTCDPNGNAGADCPGICV